MPDIVSLFNGLLHFSVTSDLEKYRVESILTKEPETIAWIDGWEVEDRNSVFYDIGANIGIYSIYASFKHRNLDVFSFEPVLNNYVALQQNIWLNQYLKVNPVHLAISNNASYVNLYLSDTRVGNSGAQIDQAINERGESFEALRVEKILSITLDRLISDFNFPVPTYVKIDVDGHETDILNGMTQTLEAPNLKSLLVEFNSDAEFAHWRDRFKAVGLSVDTRYDDLPNHSRIRRVSKGTLARNYIFSRVSVGACLTD